MSAIRYFVRRMTPFVAGIVILAAIFGTGVAFVELIDAEDARAIEVFALVALVMVTGIYVVVTNKIATATTRQAELSERARRATHMPIVDLQITRQTHDHDEPTLPKDLSIRYQNIGLGPALNFSVTLEHEGYAFDVLADSVLAIDQPQDRQIRKVQWPNNKPQSLVPRLVARYEDVFRTRCVSTLWLRRDESGIWGGDRFEFTPPD